MELPTASVSQQASQSSGRESRESANANFAKSLIGAVFSNPIQLHQRR